MNSGFDLMISYLAACRLARSVLSETARLSGLGGRLAPDDVIGAFLVSPDYNYSTPKPARFITAAVSGGLVRRGLFQSDPEYIINPAGEEVVRAVASRMAGTVEVPADVMGWLTHFASHRQRVQTLDQAPQYDGPRMPLDLVLAAAAMNPQTGNRPGDRLREISHDSQQMLLLVAVESTQVLDAEMVTTLNALLKTRLVTRYLPPDRPNSLNAVTELADVTLTNVGEDHLSTVKAGIAGFAGENTHDSLTQLFSGVASVARAIADQSGVVTVPTIVPGATILDREVVFEPEIEPDEVAEISELPGRFGNKDLIIAYAAVNRFARFVLVEMARSLEVRGKLTPESIVGAFAVLSDEAYSPPVPARFLKAAKNLGLVDDGVDSADGADVLTAEGEAIVAAIAGQMEGVEFPTEAIGWLAHFGNHRSMTEALDQAPQYDGPKTPLDLVLAAAAMNPQTGNRAGDSSREISHDSQQMLLLVAIGSTESLDAEMVKTLNTLLKSRLIERDPSIDQPLSFYSRRAVTDLAEVRLTDAGEDHLESVVDGFAAFADIELHGSLTRLFANAAIVLRALTDEFDLAAGPTIMPGTIGFGITVERQELGGEIVDTAQWPGLPGHSRTGGAQRWEYDSSLLRQVARDQLEASTGNGEPTPGQ